MTRPLPLSITPPPAPTSFHERPANLNPYKWPPSKSKSHEPRSEVESVKGPQEVCTQVIGVDRGVCTVTGDKGGS